MAVTEGYYVACCSGIPDHGRVPVQLLPSFLMTYRPSSLSLWQLSIAMFALPGFVAGWFLRRAPAAWVALATLLAIWVHAAVVLWRYEDSYARFQEEVVGAVEYNLGLVILGCAYSTLLVIVPTVLGVVLGKWFRGSRAADSVGRVGRL
jgi:hypothetical protein